MVEVGAIPEKPPGDPLACAKRRILYELNKPGFRSPGEPEGPFGRPWSWVRMAIGGKVPAPLFRQAVDELLAEGLVFEVWLEPVGRREAAHVLLLPGGLPRPVPVYQGCPTPTRVPRVVRARGRQDLLPGQRWAADVGRAGASSR